MITVIDSALFHNPVHLNVQEMVDAIGAEQG
jgi:hypothetical protein